MAGRFPNVIRNINLQIPEAEQTPNRRNPKKFTSRPNIIKVSEDWEAWH